MNLGREKYIQQSHWSWAQVCKFEMAIGNLFRHKSPGIE